MSADQVICYDLPMDILWYGQACFKLKGKTASLIIDPYESESTGLKLPKDMEADVAIRTHEHADHSNIEAVTGEPIKISGPGEYEIKGVAISGIPVYHDKSEGSERGKNTVYNINIDGINVVHLGDLGHLLTEEQIGQIGACDILLIPVGGVYTITAQEAPDVIAQLEPKIVIPMHYKIEGLMYELSPIEEFLKAYGSENTEAQPKLAVTKEKLPEDTQVVILNKV